MCDQDCRRKGGFVSSFNRHAHSELICFCSLPSGKHHQGLCSSFLAKHAAGTVVPGHLLSTRFKLPTDPATPVVMVAGGTGIAPFKAFVDERMVVSEDVGLSWK